MMFQLQMQELPKGGRDGMGVVSQRVKLLRLKVLTYVCGKKIVKWHWPVLLFCVFFFF